MYGDWRHRGAYRRMGVLLSKVTSAEKGPCRYYMLKEIFEQPAVIAETLEGRIYKGKLLEEAFGCEAKQLLSYHVAILKGTDVDQLRNLAKSVAVE